MESRGERGGPAATATMLPRARTRRRGRRFLSTSHTRHVHSPLPRSPARPPSLPTVARRAARLFAATPTPPPSAVHEAAAAAAAATAAVESRPSRRRRRRYGKSHQVDGRRRIRTRAGLAAHQHRRPVPMPKFCGALVAPTAAATAAAAAGAAAAAAAAAAARAAERAAPTAAAAGGARQRRRCSSSRPSPPPRSASLGWCPCRRGSTSSAARVAASTRPQPAVTRFLEWSNMTERGKHRGPLRWGVRAGRAPPHRPGDRSAPAYRWAHGRPRRQRRLSPHRRHYRHPPPRPHPRRA